MNIFLLGFVSQLVILYGMILFSDYLKAVSAAKPMTRTTAKIRIKKS